MGYRNFSSLFVTQATLSSELTPVTNIVLAEITTPVAGTGQAGDYWLNTLTGYLYGPATGSPTVWPSVPVAIYNTVAGPYNFSVLGWTYDPIDCYFYNSPPVGKLFLQRFKAAYSGSASHVYYTTGTSGTSLTTGENFIGIYDTGQTTSGVATLLAQTADLTSTLSAGAITPSTPLTSNASIVVGQDYFVALLINGTTAPTFVRSSGTNLYLMNSSLSGLNLRVAAGGSGLTSLPSTIPAANIVIDTTAYNWTFLVKTF